MSDTPRTDALQAELAINLARNYRENNIWHFARQLERENRDLREATIEECAKICDEYALKLWKEYKTGHGPERANPNTQGESDGAGACAIFIRALKAEGKSMSDTQRTDAELVRVYGRTGEVCAATTNCGHRTYVPSDFARQLERENHELRKALEYALETEWPLWAEKARAAIGKA
jgi:hypothetical protein